MKLPYKPASRLIAPLALAVGMSVISLGFTGVADAATVISSPTAGSCFAAGSTIPVTWSINDLLKSYSYVAYSDGSSTPSYQQPSNISGGDHAAVSGTLNWTAPAVTGSNYSVYVASLNGLNGRNSSSTTAMFSIDATGPSQPGLVAQLAGKTAAKLSWSPVSDPGCMPFGGYRVYRNDSLVATTSHTFFTDVGLLPDTPYDYRVEAFDAAGMNSWSGAVRVTTPTVLSFITNPTAPLGASTAPAPQTSTPSPSAGNTGLVALNAYTGNSDGAVHYVSGLKHHTNKPLAALGIGMLALSGTGLVALLMYTLAPLVLPKARARALQGQFDRALDHFVVWLTLRR